MPCWLVVTETWLVFFHIFGMSSSQLTNSYFSEGLKPPTSPLFRCHVYFRLRNWCTLLSVSRSFLHSVNVSMWLLQSQHPPISRNRDTPKSSISSRIFQINHPALNGGSPWLWNPPMSMSMVRTGRWSLCALNWFSCGSTGSGVGKNPQAEFGPV